MQRVLRAPAQGERLLTVEEIQKLSAQRRAAAKEPSLVEVSPARLPMPLPPPLLALSLPDAPHVCSAACRRAPLCPILPQGVLEETRLIKWPSPVQALLQTVLVVAMVAATSALLFGMNTLLAEASRLAYH